MINSNIAYAADLCVQQGNNCVLLVLVVALLQGLQVSGGRKESFRDGEAGGKVQDGGLLQL